MKNKRFVFLIIAVVISSGVTWDCGNNHKESLKNYTIPVAKFEDDNHEHRVLDTTNYSPMRIYVDYTNLESDSTLSFDWISNVKIIVNQTLDLFRSILLVKPLANKLKISTCAIDKTEYTTPTLSSQGVDADIAIFVIKDNLENAEAWATSCLLSPIDHRPIAGIIGLTNKVMFDKTNWLNYFSYLILHEMTHVFVMSPTLFQLFWNNDLSTTQSIDDIITTNVNINGESRIMIKTPLVMKAAANHFNCAALIGVELENQGGTGSAGGHWESRVMLGDYMIASSYEDIFISEITLALFEDSGWYTTKKYTGGLFKYGKNEGCKFLDEKCVVNGVSSFPDYFCTVNKDARCMAGGKYKGYCQLTVTDNNDPNYQYFPNSPLGGFLYSDFCPIARSYYDSDYYYGGHCTIGKPKTYPNVVKESISTNSGCFISNIYQENSDVVYNSYLSVCYEYSCDMNITSVVISIDANTKINCPFLGGSVSVKGYIGQVICPAFNDYCTSSVQCFDIKDCIDKKSVLASPSQQKSATSTSSTVQSTTDINRITNTTNTSGDNFLANSTVPGNQSSQAWGIACKVVLVLFTFIY